MKKAILALFVILFAASLKAQPIANPNRPTPPVNTNICVVTKLELKERDQQLSLYFRNNLEVFANSSIPTK